MNQLDYQILLATHLVCADQQIHSQELKFLREMATKRSVGQNTIEEMEKILAQDESMLSLENIARQIPPSQQSEVMAQLLTLAYIDRFFSPLEREMVIQVAQIWNWSTGKIEGFLELSAVSNTFKPIQNGTPSRDSLWGDVDYKAAIDQCNKIAQEDFRFTDSALQATQTTLDNLKTDIERSLEAINRKTSGNARAETAQEVAKQLEITKQSLEVEIFKKIKDVCESLNAKQRALNYFTIAFMGKTKAGKSTLHAIMTGEGWDAIGVGKQRTTRLNRVYDWENENIRIIDTPGIGAPGGKTDEEIAQSVINEADVICYVVTNDSIQETEFSFLRLLKENAKPLIILLNVHKNFRDSKRGPYELDKFLKNPDKLFTLDGPSGLGGHIERIRRYAQQHYGNDYFETVPVMLLAAQLSYEEKHQEHKEQLFQASRMQNFLDELWLSLVEHGAIRRSQTLLGCTVGEIAKPYNLVKEQAQTYNKLTDTLRNKRGTIHHKINQAANDANEALKGQIQSIFQNAINIISSFAEANWDCSESDMNKRWDNKLKEIGLEKRIKVAYQEAAENFNKEVQETIEEVGKELQLIAKLGTGFNFDKQDSENFFRHGFRIGGSLLGLIGAGLLLFSNPIGWAFVIVGGLAGILSGFFKSKAQKRREAVEKISSSLRKQLDNQKTNTLKSAGEQLAEHCRFVGNNVDTYFKDFI